MCGSNCVLWMVCRYIAAYRVCGRAGGIALKGLVLWYNLAMKDWGHAEKLSD
ncbi:MAG: hypothetical protein H5T98_07250 [Syntrophomonadaceae bacterium]|nr:hypothetical protein [Syntrophomonadaceae bacterium]